MRSNGGSPGALDSPLHKKLSHCSAKLGHCSTNSAVVLETQDSFKLKTCSTNSVAVSVVSARLSCWDATLSCCCV
jgi:hypothetical protein